MPRYLLALVLVGAAVAQQDVELTSADGDMIINRRQTISVGAMSSTIAAQEATIANLVNEVSRLTGTVASLTSTDSPIAIGIQNIAADMTARTNSLFQQGIENSQAVASMQATISSTAATLNNQQQAALAAINSRAAEQEASVTATLSTTAANLTAASESRASALSAMVASLSRNVTTSLANAAPATVHTWIGYCRNRANSGDHDYCLNGVDKDTAAPYFRKESNTRMRTMRHGFYYISFLATKQSCNWGQHKIYVDGRHRTHGHNWAWASRGHLNDEFSELTWEIPANKQFWGRTYAGCWHAYWSGNSGGAHSRFVATYLGKAS